MSKDQPVSRQPPRFLLLDDVAAELATSRAQVYALVRDGSLPAIKVGGRGRWRVERAKLEAFIVQAYEATALWVRDNPFGGDAAEPRADGGERGPREAPDDGGVGL